MDATHEENSDANLPGKSSALADRQRKMVPAELMGCHSHETHNGVCVHIYRRDGKYMARARLAGRFIGKTLGADAKQASFNLRHILTELEKGTFVRPSEERRRPLPNRTVPKFDLRELCSVFLAEKRKLRGQGTASDYLNRLRPVMYFADLPASRKRWPLAMDLDREFAVELRAFLFSYSVTRNGRPGASPKPMSVRQVHNVLSCLQGMLAWAHRAEVHNLPSDFVNPITAEIVGSRPAKDPLRPVKLTMERRIELVQTMDLWQLTHLGLFLTLPMRPDEVSGLLISDVDREQRHLSFATRFNGKDFTKARQSFRVPFHQDFLPLLELCQNGRTEGPLLRRRSIFENKKRVRLKITSSDDLQARFEKALFKAGEEKIKAEQDAKSVFRSLLLDLGGVSPDELAKEFKKLLAPHAWAKGVRFYDLRGAISTDMNRAGIGLLEMRYLTGHSASDIMNQYVSLEIETPMARYFEQIQPLLLTISERIKLLMSG